MLQAQIIPPKSHITWFKGQSRERQPTCFIIFSHSPPRHWRPAPLGSVTLQDFSVVKNLKVPGQKTQFYAFSAVVVFDQKRVKAFCLTRLKRVCTHLWKSAPCDVTKRSSATPRVWCWLHLTSPRPGHADSLTKASGLAGSYVSVIL